MGVVFYREKKKFSAGELPQTHALDRTATGTGKQFIYRVIFEVITAVLLKHVSRKLRSFRDVNPYGLVNSI